MTVWKKIENGNLYAVAIYNYTATSSRQLSLEVGELVHLVGESRGWYWAVSLRKHKQGALPKSYVVVRDCTVERCGEATLASAGGVGVAHDIALTLRDWLFYWKKLYVNNDERFKFMEVSMRALLELRAQAASGALPQDQLKKISRTAIFTIDKGNRSLGMELAVRSSSGQPIDPMSMSTYELNALHEEANARIDKNMESTPHFTQPTSTARAYTLLVSINNLICRSVDTCVPLLALLRANGDRVTEACKLSSLPNAHVAFTDLGSDIKKEKVYLVCYVIRIGSMEPQNVDIRRASLAQSQASEPQGGTMRRPFGIACADITRYLAADDPHLDIRLPFYACEKENMDSLLRKIMTNRDLKEAKHSQGLWVSLQLIEGDLKQIREEHPHLILGNTIKARKMGFPEVILPGDARNDLYVTVVGGSFSKGGKSSERNIELCARLVDKHGKIIPNVISIGAGSPLVSEFTSIVYYHDDRPRWQEVFKVCLNIETFKESHIVFFVRHRSSNEAKDRQELRFAMSYLRLMQKDGTTTPDMMHNLCVYKIDSKHGADVETEASALCLALPVHKDELPEGCERGLKRGPLSLVHRDVLTVNTTLCSTKLTQREEILGVLKWNTRRAEGTLRHALIRLMSVPGEELVKFLQDILDALFAILTQVDEDSDGFHDQSYGVLVLDCLLRVISVVSDHKFQHFQPVLHVYIDHSFCDALAYEKLISVMVWVITSADQGEMALKRLLQCMKCLECVLRFVARSRQLRSSLSGPDTEHDFRAHFQSFLEALVWLMRCGDHALTCQGSALKYWPQAVSHVITVYPHTDTSLYTVRALNALPMARLSKQRVLALRELVKGPLCRRQSARAPLFLHAASTIASLLKAKNEEQDVHKSRSVDKAARLLGADTSRLQDVTTQRQIVELCIETIGEMMSLLNRTDIGPVEADRTEAIRRLLPTAMRCAFAMIKQRSDNVPDDPHLRRTICVLLDMIRQMSTEEYSSVVKALEAETSSSGSMLSEALQLLTSLLQRPVFSVHWADMLHLQMNIMLHALRLMSTTLRSRLHHSTPSDFSSTVANIRSWFDACASLATSKELNEPVRLTRRQKDMCVEVRRGVPVTMCDMWDSLGTHKMSFLPHVVGAFLEVSFLKDDEVRYATIPLLFDMMRVHFEHSQMCQENVDNPLKVLENELIDKIDVIAERGGGDIQWRSMFVTLCGGMAALAEPELRESSAALIAACARQLDALLDYRSATSHLHKMHLTTGVLNFYEQIDRPAQYIRYVHKLANMHRQSGQWAEAGLCLKLHAKLLKWNGDPLESTLKHPEEDTQHATHRELKEYLYLEIAELLNRGHQWELAVENVKELVTEYEENLAGYGAMAQLHTQLANTYTAMLTVPRSHPQYFRVLYHGKGFPEQFRNKYGFIYRGNEYEQLQDFRDRMLDEWPDANVLNKLDPPGEDITESHGQYLQINPVEPEMSEKLKRFSGKPAACQILQYYKHNNVDKFSFSRPYHKAEESVDGSTEDISQNEFATRWLERTEVEIRDKLPGIVRWSVITHQRTYSVCPLEAAVEALGTTNEALKRLILSTRDNDDPLHPLTMRLNGILDPAVMGGTANYEKAFLTQSYLERHPEHAELRNQLLNLIADQIPLLKYGLEVHKARMPPALEALHDHMQKCFNKMQNHVHQRYGKKMGDFEPETPEVQLRITLRDSLLTDPGVMASNRISDVSTGNDSLSKSKFSLLNSAVNPLASRNSSGGVTNYFGTLQNSPKRRDKRRTRKSEIGTSSSGSQWYTSTPNGTANVANEQKTINILNNVNNNLYSTDSSNSNSSTPLRELRQELVTERPLRAEVERERRLSQRASLLNSSAPPSNRDSLGTTDSNQDEDEPPPLPQKSSHRSSDVDFENNNNASETNPVLPPRYNYDTVVTPRGSFLYTSMARKKIEKGPTPPPKKKNMHNNQ